MSGTQTSKFSYLYALVGIVGIVAFLAIFIILKTGTPIVQQTIGPQSPDQQSATNTQGAATQTTTATSANPSCNGVSMPDCASGDTTKVSCGDRVFYCNGGRLTNHVQPKAQCAYNGKSYEPGTTFPSGDGCNSCSCLPGGRVSCTTHACGGAK